MPAAVPASASALWRNASVTSDQASGDVVGHKPPTIAAEYCRVGMLGPVPTATNGPPDRDRSSAVHRMQRDYRPMSIRHTTSTARVRRSKQAIGGRRCNAEDCV